MLSFLYRLVQSFRQEHGFAPNVLYLNESHYQALRENLFRLSHDETERFLRLHVVLLPEVLHPRVAWQEPARRQAVGGG